MVNQMGPGKKPGWAARGYKNLKKVRLLREMRTHGGVVFPEGTVLDYEGCCRGWLTLSRLRGVDPNDVAPVLWIDEPPAETRCFCRLLADVTGALEVPEQEVFRRYRGTPPKMTKHARSVLCWLVRETLSLSYAKIGKLVSMSKRQALLAVARVQSDVYDGEGEYLVSLKMVLAFADCRYKLFLLRATTAHP